MTNCDEKMTQTTSTLDDEIDHAAANAKAVRL